MWPTIDGLRVLKDAEASLVCRSVGVMVNRLKNECDHEAEAWLYGIDWFDQWDVDQRIWLLEQVTLALLTPAQPLGPAAIWEATIDTVFCNVIESITDEIDESSIPTGDHSWRRCAIDAFGSQHGRLPNIDAHESELRPWRTLVTQVADAILGVISYQKAEQFRDGDIQKSRRFLAQKGLPEDFLERIPPLRTVEQTRDSIDRIEAIVQV